MARDKPAYKGYIFKNPKYNLEEEVRKLRQLKIDISGLFPELPVDKANECFDSVRERFVAEIINVVCRAKSEVFHMQFDTTKGETFAEQEELLRITRNTAVGLNSLIKKIPSVSPALERLLAAEFDSVDIVASLRVSTVHVQQLINILEDASPRLKGLPKATKTQDKHHKIASELIRNILDIFKKYGIKVSTINSSYWDKSNLINLLVVVGNSIGLALGGFTWANKVNEILKIEKIHNPHSVGGSR